MRNQRVSVKVNPVKKLKSPDGEEGETVLRLNEFVGVVVFVVFSGRKGEPEPEQKGQRQ